MMAKKMTKVFLSVLFSLCSLLMLTGIALTATFTVNTTNDTVDVAPGDGSCADSNGNCSLRAAIMEANAFPGADTIHVPSGRYILSLDPVDGFDDSAAGGDLDITGDLTLIGAGAETTIIDGDNKYQVFHTRAKVTLSGITVTRGYQGCGDGGGIVNAYGALTIADSIITGNSANQCGSTGGNGGGVCNDGYYKNAQLTIINSTVSNNLARGSNPLGGGIVSSKVGSGTVSLTIINSTITGNNAGQWGGSGYGGGIANSGGTLEIRGSVISNNGAHSGGGLRIWQEDDTITITDSTISGNTAWNISGLWSGSGGGIFAVVNNLTITNSTISGNATSYGAEGGHSAAGIQIQQGNVTIANSTVSGNNASRTDVGMTGGIINGGALTVISSTITNNRGSVGGINRIAGTVMLSNSIVANQAVGPNCSGTITSNGYNLDSDGTCSLNASGDIPNGTANLGLLSDNGGKTRTHALLTGSQAINAGNNAMCTSSPVNGKDQRGFSRWDGACDMGALESMPLHQLTLNTLGPGHGQITANLGKINCPGICADQLPENMAVTLTVTIEPGSAFTGWRGNCSGENTTLQFVMDEDKACIATFNLYPLILDFNADRKADIRWQHPATGTFAIWLMDGSAVGSVGILGSIPTDWEIKGMGDFDGDGRYDILWQHPDTGTVAFWFLDGATITSVGVTGTAPRDWEIKGVGDFDGDGESDILWQHPATGTIAIWIMDGASVVSLGIPGSIQEEWEIKGIGDFDGDRNSDILWQNSATGNLILWMMNGISISLAKDFDSVPGDWQVKSLGDFDGDGKFDILWQHPSSGTVAIWFMEGASISSIEIPGAVSTDWQIKGSGDFNGDSKSDILWQHNSTGTLAIWFMNGSTISSIGVPGAVPLDWNIMN